MNMEVVGFFGGITSISAAVPQILKCIRTKQTKDLSYATNVVSYVGSSISMYYGVSIGHKAIVLCNVYSMVINTLLLSTKLYFEVLCTRSNNYILVDQKQQQNGEPILGSV